MKQSSLDIAMNYVLNAIYNCNINNQDKLELLLNIKLFFKNYEKTIGGVEQSKIEAIDFSKERRN